MDGCVCFVFCCVVLCDPPPPPSPVRWVGGRHPPSSPPSRSYMAPEVMLNQGHNRCADFWSARAAPPARAAPARFGPVPCSIRSRPRLIPPPPPPPPAPQFGVLIFEMLTGGAPFAGEEDARMAKILSGKVVFPPDFPPDARDCVTRLCQRDISRRLGMSACRRFCVPPRARVTVLGRPTPSPRAADARDPIPSGEGHRRAARPRVLCGRGLGGEAAAAAAAAASAPAGPPSLLSPPPSLPPDAPAAAPRRWPAATCRRRTCPPCGRSRSGTRGRLCGCRRAWRSTRATRAPSSASRGHPTSSRPGGSTASRRPPQQPGRQITTAPAPLARRRSPAVLPSALSPGRGSSGGAAASDLACLAGIAGGRASDPLWPLLLCCEFTAPEYAIH